MELEIEELEGSILEFRLRENLTAANVTHFKEVLESKINDDECPEKILINFLDIGFLDSSGISSLVTLHRKLKKLGKGFVIVYESKQLEEVFVLTKLNKLFPLEKDYDDALDRLS